MMLALGSLPNHIPIKYRGLIKKINKPLKTHLQNMSVGHLIYNVYNKDGCKHNITK
jgi:hypothetical protein